MTLTGASKKEAKQEKQAAAARQAMVVQSDTEALVPADKAVLAYYPVECAVCALQGTLSVRRAGDSDFDEIPLSTRVDASGHHTVAGLVPADYTTGAGFDYYVEIEDKRGHAITLPGGGAAAPQHSWVVSRWTTVELGKQGFESTRLPDAVLVKAPWGKGDNDVGLIYRHRGLPLYGPSAFDVAKDGSIVLLDQLNDRLSFYSPESLTPPRHRPIPFTDVHGDLALDGNGTIYVLDPRKNTGATVRSFTHDGKLLASTQLAEGAQTLAIGPQGPIALIYPDGQWVPVGAGRNLLAPQQQKAGARSVRDLPRRSGDRRQQPLV